MGVMMEAFYWNCPTEEKVVGQWWSTIAAKLPGLKQVGFTALWLPPASKAASIGSMGYDPYDYYDLGDLNQKGGTSTLFGAKQDLMTLVAAAHAAPSIQLYADLVLNHNSGADSQEANPIDGQMRWTKFSPASNLFARDYTDFHPCKYESWDGYQQCGSVIDLNRHAWHQQGSGGRARRS